MEYEIGEEITYYPEKAGLNDNRHWQAKIIGFTKTGRLRIEGENLAGKFKLTCILSRVARQPSLLPNG